MTVTQRDGVLTITNGRLHFTPEVYPTEHLRNEGWRKEPDGSWSAPLASDYARQLRVLFPGVVGDDRFLQWYATPTQPSSVSLLHAGKPESWDRLYSYQQRAAQWLAGRRSALLGYGPGLGKTPVTLTALQMATPHPLRGALVVCPLTLLSNWQQEAKRWWPQAKVVLQEPEIFSLTDTAPLLSVITYDAFRQSVYDRVRQGKKPDGTPRWVYVPRKATLLEWKRRVDVLIFDESVLLKNRQAVRTKAAAARKVIPICWELSGSPTTRFYDDLWAQLHILEPKQYPSYWRFARRFTLIQDSVWGKSVVANVPNVEPTLKRDLAPLMLTYNYTDLAREEPERAIPEWVFETRQVPLPEKWWKLYKQMQDKFMADLPDGTRILAPNTLARLVRLLQFASHPALLLQETIVAQDGAQDIQDFSDYDWSTKGGKLSAIPELLDELPGPTIVWTNFIATAKHLSETLKAPCLIGETPAEERTRIVAEFQAGQHPVLIAHPGVGRFGLTLTRARSMIFAERSHNADYYLQALYRCRRIGTTEPPQVVILEATGPNGEPSIDRAISRILSYRKDRSEQLTTALLKETLR